LPARCALQAEGSGLPLDLGRDKCRCRTKPRDAIRGLSDLRVYGMLHHSISLSNAFEEPAAMKLEELNGRYQHLRSELDAAYAAPIWDSNRINRITEEMAPVELALASLECERSLADGGSNV
jgi:hypothetical protein